MKMKMEGKIKWKGNEIKGTKQKWNEKWSEKDEDKTKGKTKMKGVWKRKGK